MALIEAIDKAYLEAARAKDADTVSTLRMIKSSIKNEMINAKKETLADDEVTKILKSEIKKRKDSIESYTSAGRTDLAEKEQKELALIEKYLPAQLSEEQVRAKVDEILATITDKSNFGKVMGQVMGALKNQADGALVKKAVEEKLK